MIMARFYRNEKGVTYVYETVSTWDKELKQARTKQVLIGKIDGDGNVIPNRSYKKKSSSPVEEEVIILEAVNPDDEKNTYRTIKKAREMRDEDNKPVPISSANLKSIALITLHNFENAVSFCQKGYAYMQPLNVETSTLRFENGEMFFDGCLEPISTVQLQNMITKEGIEHIDIPLLSVFYSIILNDFQLSLKNEEHLNPVTTIYIPELAQRLDLNRNGVAHRNLSRKDIALIISKTMSFHNILGILKVMRNGKPDNSYYPVLNFEGYNAENNTVSFSSSYFNHVINVIYNASLKRDKRGNIKLSDRNNKPIEGPSHSYLVKPEIAKEKNKAAVENVFIIVKLIEQAGDNVPHIKAITIIDRNMALSIRLLQDKHPSRLLDRVFTKTLELLPKYTRLTEVYLDIQLPDPKDKRNIPTISNLNDIVLEFPHKGKK